MVKKYCAVYGCLNSTLHNPGLAFFKLRSSADRFTEWLRLINRQDLMSKNPHNYFVCEEHFSDRDISVTSNRKTLRHNCLPSINLPFLQKLDKETQTVLIQVEKRVQTDKPIVISRCIQTRAAASSDTPQVRKLKLDLLQCRRKLNALKKMDRSQDEKELLQDLCDKYLTEELADMVRTQISGS